MTNVADNRTRSVVVLQCACVVEVKSNKLTSNDNASSITRVVASSDHESIAMSTVEPHVRAQVEEGLSLAEASAKVMYSQCCFSLNKLATVLRKGSWFVLSLYRLLVSSRMLL